MMTTNRKKLFASFNGNAPASTAAISQFEKETGICLPEAYKQFLQHADGGEGFIGQGAYIILWRVEELLEMNNAYQVSEYAHGLLIFGSDGGGEAFAFDMRSDLKPIVSVPFVGMDLRLARSLAPTFDRFLNQLANL